MNIIFPRVAPENSCGICIVDYADKYKHPLAPTLHISDIEPQSETFTKELPNLLDVETALFQSQQYRDKESFWIYERELTRLGASFALGLVAQTKEPEESLTWVFENLKDWSLNLWVVSLFDEALDFNGGLCEPVVNFLATGIHVSKKGKVYEVKI